MPEPGTKIIHEVHHSVRINGRDFTVVEIIWNDTVLRSFDVYAPVTSGDESAMMGDCLTEAESFDDFPTDEQILDAEQDYLNERVARHGGQEA